MSAAVTCIAVAIAERRDTQREHAGRVEEILEVTEIVDEAADRLVAVLERSGADRLHGSLRLRDLARNAFDGAAVDIARRAFGSPAAEYDRLD